MQEWPPSSSFSSSSTYYHHYYYYCYYYYSSSLLLLTTTSTEHYYYLPFLLAADKDFLCVGVRFLISVDNPVNGIGNLREPSPIKGNDMREYSSHLFNAVCSSSSVDGKWRLKCGQRCINRSHQWWQASRQSSSEIQKPAV